ncbi:pilus assembly protein [Litoribrevibacter albus]|uniref:Pilus biosynthesis protein n=1 Tax=Litoribrevibacter albus TaxID=1473156 RepID=A0AA37SG38_9GAMM|nr:PilC/PilY family type IV pilus protein [Litoribrevibacter albus]GLQ33680.1 pilus biosynthesis protein [Litoribrevibacter albus]
MITKRLSNKIYSVGLLMISSYIYAAPGVIKDRPLFLGFSVQPNIYFVMDDSGSMAWDVTKTKEAEDAHPKGTYYFSYEYCKKTDKQGRCKESAFLTDKYYLHDDYEEYLFNSGHLPSKISTTKTPLYPSTFYSSTEELDSQGYLIDDILQMCAGYNSTAYDSSIEYTPWAGSYSQSSVSLNSDYGYVPWNDLDHDGLYDKGECSTEYSDIVQYTSMSTTEKQNFRNWYTYYRTRKNVAKKAVGEVIENSEARMGMNTIWNRVRYSVSDMRVESNKTSLLSSVYSVGSSSGTPLRSALEEAGEYFKGGNSPIQAQDKGGSCQQNYTILMTDGYWNSDTDWTGPGDIDGLSTNEYVRASDRDSYSNTLADVALKYYATDFFEDNVLADEVPTIEGVDENPGQHMVTFTVAFGVNGQIVPNSSVSGQETDEDGMPLYPDKSFSWPKPESNKSSTIDDIRHAAWNGHGLYLNANNPQSLIESLEASIDEIESRTGTASALAFNSTSYRTDSKFYYAQFTSGSWGGELIAQQLTGDLQVGDVEWKASEKLDAKQPDQRNILTYDVDAGNAVAFRKNSLPSAHLSDLKTLYNSDYISFYQNAGKGENDFISDAVDYLRGERSREGASEGAFRDRSTVLGDIINSAPVYVSGAASSWPDYIEPGYISYMRSLFSRTPMLYVGSNDGMLHAFNASNGEEQFAFIPAGVVSTEADRGLHYLVDKSYNHRYYVDGTVEVADAYIGGAWKTLLLGGLGAGGKSIFAIDVTDPETITESTSNKVLWEVSLDSLGLTYPQAKVAKMNDGSWVVLLANGYHNLLDGKAKIFMLDIATGALLKTFDTGVGALSSGQCLDACNGMSSITVRDLDGNGTGDFIYAGDLKGNVWAINTFSTNPSEWVFDSQITYDNGTPKSYSGSQITPVFITEGQRPITTELVVVDNPVVFDVKTWPNQLLFFGTGQFLAEGDHDSADAEYVYTVMHANSKYNLSISSDSNLFAERVIKVSSVLVDGETIATRSIEPANSSEATFLYGYESDESGISRKMGWYLALPASGERIIHNPLRASDYVIFNSLIPEVDPCTFGASGFTMAISLLYGSNPGPILDFNRDGEINEEDSTLAGYQLKSPPAGLTRLGNDGIGQSTFEKPIIELFSPHTNEPNKISWEELK